MRADLSFLYHPSLRPVAEKRGKRERRKAFAEKREERVEANASVLLHFCLQPHVAERKTGKRREINEVQGWLFPLSSLNQYTGARHWSTKEKRVFLEGGRGRLDRRGTILLSCTSRPRERVEQRREKKESCPGSGRGTRGGQLEAFPRLPLPEFLEAAPPTRRERGKKRFGRKKGATALLVLSAMAS